MEAADTDLHTGGKERPGDIDGARKLVRLHPDEPDQGAAAGLADRPDDTLRTHPPVRLVIRVQEYLCISTNDLAPLGIFREAVQAGQGIGGNGGTKPLDRVAVVVIVRWLDDDKMQQRGRSIRRPPLRHDLYPLPVPKRRRLRLSRRGSAGQFSWSSGVVRLYPRWG